jgi:hypothetical protein
MFSIKLNVSNNVEKSKITTSSISNSSMNEVLMEICNEFHRYPELITFSISGFDKDWSNININSDLCMLMEDMPQLINFIKNKDLQEFQFGFPEQHIQRMFTVVHTSNELKISCSDWLSKNPEVTEEFVKTSDLLSLLHELVEKIKLAVDRVYPVAHDNIFFKDWLQQVQM